MIFNKNMSKDFYKLLFIPLLVATPLLALSINDLLAEEKDIFSLDSSSLDNKRIILKAESTKDHVNLLISGVNGKYEVSDKRLGNQLEIYIKPEISNSNLISQSLSLPEAGILNASISGTSELIILKIIPLNKSVIDQFKIINTENNPIIQFPKIAKSFLPKDSKNIFSLKPIKPKPIDNLPKRAIPPPLGDIATGTSYIPNPNLIHAEGPKVSLILKNTPARQALDFLFSKVDYGFVWVQADPTHDSGQPTNSFSIEDISDDTQPLVSAPLSSTTQSTTSEESTSDSPRLITLSIKDQPFSMALNTVLMASGLQAKMDNNIIFIGPNVRDTVFINRISKIYRLNQTTANAAASYLANLGAQVTRTTTITTAVTEGAGANTAVAGASSSATTTSESRTQVQVYGSDIGPLVGLIATTDDRLETITLIGSQQLIEVAEGYIKQLDLRQRQVALTVQILDINISDGNILNKSWAFKQNNAFIVNAGGKLLLSTTRLLPPGLGSFGVATPDSSSFTRTADATEFRRTIWENPGNQSEYVNQEFINFLRAEITSTNTKILASPTLILNEYPGATGGNSVAFSDVATTLTSSTIGRSFGNEAFVMVGSQLPINCTADGDSGVPSFEYGISGLTFGARVLRIDDNGFVTINISPAVSAPAGTRDITNCGTISLLSTRRVDSGAIRIRDGHTLILTGVLTTEDKETTSKIPFLGDIPVIGSLFRNTDSGKTQRELIILVTPQILEGSDALQGSYTPVTEDAKELLNQQD